MSKKTLFDVQQQNGIVIIKEGSTAIAALTQREAIDLIRAITSALMSDKSGFTFSVGRDSKGRGDPE